MFNRIIAVIVLGASLSGCASPEATEPEVPAPLAPMSLAQGEGVVAQVFFEHGCDMSIAEYVDALDDSEYTVGDVDITTTLGHVQAANRSMLEGLPMVLASAKSNEQANSETDLLASDPETVPTPVEFQPKFTRSGSQLTSHIGNCAPDQAPEASFLIEIS